MRDTPESSLEPLRVTAAKTEAQMEMTAYFRRHIHVEGHHGFRFSFALLGGKLLKTAIPSMNENYLIYFSYSQRPFDS